MGQNKKTPTSPKSGGGEAKKNIIRNNFTLHQIKKLIGKKLLLMWPSLVISIQTKNSSKLIRTKILDIPKDSTSLKNLVITAMCSGGLLYVIKGAETFLAIGSISYKELDNIKNTNINVLIIQYPKLNKKEIKDLIN